MGRIKDIIDNRYKEIADRLRSRKNNKDYFNKAKARNSKKFPHHISEFDDCNETFYILLKEVKEAAEMNIRHDKLFDFFNGHFFIDFNSIDLEGDIPAELLKVVDYKRIASILYYAEHHKRFVEELEEAYQEVINQIIDGISDVDVWYAGKSHKSINTLTQSCVKAAADKTYDVIYNNPELEEKYRLSKEDYYNQLTQSEIVYITSYINTTQLPSLSPSAYETILISLMTDDNFYSYETCLQECYIPKYGTMDIANDTVFGRYFKNTISPIAGYKYEEVQQIYKVERKFILKTLGNDYSDCVHFFFLKFNGARNLEYLIDEPNASRLKITNDLNDLKEICNTIKIYNRILSVFQYILGKKYRQLLHRSKDLDFIRKIMANNLV